MKIDFLNIIFFKIGGTDLLVAYPITIPSFFVNNKISNSYEQQLA